MRLNEGLVFAGRYLFSRQLGRGGFSEVWLATDQLTDVKVAVKVYAPEGGLDDAGIKLFTQEFNLVFDFNHTNLLTPTYFDCWERMPYLILPYCKNGSAFKYITSDNIISEDECWQLLHDVAAGLAYLHDKTPPLVHQDIKPDNILVNDEGRFMITDFGISARVRNTISSTASEQSSGTLSYMGPERFSANPKPIMASDIWSLGAMMYELMAHGNPPFGNFGGVLQKNGADIPVIEEDYSQELKEIVYQCLAKETWERPTARVIEELSYKKIHGMLPLDNNRAENNKTPSESNAAPIGSTADNRSPETAASQPAQPLLPNEHDKATADQPAIQETPEVATETIPSMAEEHIQAPAKAPARAKKHNMNDTFRSGAPKVAALVQEKAKQPQPTSKKAEHAEQAAADGKTKTHKKLFIAAIVFVLVAAACFLYGGNDKKPEPGGQKQEPTASLADQQENKGAQIAIEQALALKTKADSICQAHPDDLFDESHEAVEAVYIEALDCIRQTEGELSSAQKEQKQAIITAVSNSLNSLAEKLDKMAAEMKSAGLTSNYEERANTIRQYINQ